MPTEYFIPSPPKEVFARPNDNPELEILRESRTQFIIDKITYDGGILVWYKDTPYPRRGFPTPEAVSAVNIVKHVFIESVKTLGLWPFTIAWFACILSKAKVERMLNSFNRVTVGVVSRYALKPEHMTPLASELQGLIFVFIRRLGIDRNASKAFCYTFGTLIEYDNAYRYRLEDIFTETTVDMLQANPYKEITRLIKLYSERELDDGVTKKFVGIWKLAGLVFMIPRVKKAFRSALSTCEFERLQFDDIDRYWANVRKDYNFYGRSYESRMIGHIPVQGYQLDV